MNNINTLINSSPAIVLSDQLRKLENNSLTYDEKDHIFHEIIIPCLIKVDGLTQKQSIQRLEKALKITKTDINKALKMAKKAHLQAVPSKQQKKKESGSEIIYSDWRDGYKNVPGYALDNKGQLCRIHMKYNPSTQDYEPVNILLANFMARIKKEIIRDDGQESKRIFEIDGFLANGRALPTVTIKAEQFYSMSWVLEYWGAGAIFSPNNGSEKYLRHAMQVFSEDKSTFQTIYCHTGWREIDNKWVYLHSGGAIGTNEDIAVDITEGNLNKYILPTIGNKEKAAEMALKLLDVVDHKIIIPLFALTYLAPLCEPLRRAGKEPAFVMWFSGESQSRKSSLAGVLLSHFGDFHSLNLPASFKDSSTNLNRKGFLLKDCLLVVDDFHPTSSKNEAQKMHALAQEIMRTWGDRQGKGRGNVDGTIRNPILPRSLCLVSGEDLPEVGQSGAARIFAVNMKKGDIDLQKLREIQSNSHLLSQNMSNYIDWLSPQINDIANTANNELNSFRDTFNEQGFAGRMPDNVAWLFYGWIKAIQYFESVGALLADQCEVFINRGLNTLLELATDHSETIQEERPDLKFIMAFNEMITTNAISTRPWGEELEADKGEIGWHDFKYYYLLPNSTHIAIVQFFDKQNEQFPVSRGTLWKHLANNGYIEPDNAKTPTKQRKVNGVNTRLIWLKKDHIKGE